ncbi:hypothetical protein [Halodesulfovibrio sp.]|jgi:hypothetical protein|uniref:hypothetical protein n=1 Tax=Halodesulfovibrio sp. TaxID=1912772 RepID=UPI0025E205FE|nr:hypothetical protein [Halodesulfovibrio sp.]MCT4534650.1 hypothetical protein [Halodesulfovibrio sp.]
MVKQCITLATLLLLIASYSSADTGQKQPAIHDLFGSYHSVHLAKLDYCFSSVTKETAKKNSKKEVILSKENFIDFWGKIQKPQYDITRQIPIIDGEVYPKHLQRLFEINGKYEDQLNLLTVSYLSNNSPFQYLEIIDANTLLLESGCWVYTLKRIK